MMMSMLTVLTVTRGLTIYLDRDYLVFYVIIMKKQIKVAHFDIVDNMYKYASLDHSGVAHE